MNSFARRILGSFRFPKFVTQPASTPVDTKPKPRQKPGEKARFIDAIKPSPLKVK